MKKLLEILVLGLLLVGCGTTIIETQTPEEFDSIARARGYSYTARAQPLSWITADGLVEHGSKQPAQGAHYTQHEANQIALELCRRKLVEGGCVIVRESGRISREAESIIARLKKDQEKKQKIEEEKKKEEDQLAKEKKEKEEEKIEKKESDDDVF